jgi:23S rRNA (pseudouridine1915-N3)-methyltransferase
MLKINIIAVGKNKDAWVDDAIRHYEKLLKKFVNLSFDFIPDIKKSPGIGENEIKKLEASKIIKKLRPGYKIALSDKGRKYNSEEFAKYLSKLMQKSGGTVEFIIGGVYGLDESIINECDVVVSLSPMTITHQLVRPILLEQLYRGFSILSGGKYHK